MKRWMVRIQDSREYPLSPSAVDDSLRRALSGSHFSNLSRPLVIAPPERFPGQWAVSFDTTHSTARVIAEILNESLRRWGFHVLGPPQISMECPTLPMPRILPRHSTHGTPGDRAH